MTGDISPTNVATIRVLAGMEVALGLAVLCGWALDIEALKSVLPGLPSLKVNAAICFILCGISLGLFAPRHPSATALFVSGLAASLTLLISLLTLAEYAFNWDAGIDQLFFREPSGMSFTASPGRMAVIAALMFLMRGIAMLLMVLRRFDLFVQGLALLSGVIALLPIGGYLFGDPMFPHIGNSSGIAAHAALGLLVLSVGILLATADRGFMARLQPKLKAISAVLSLALLLVSIAAIVHNHQESRKAASRLQQTYQQIQLAVHLQSDLFEHKAIHLSFRLTVSEELTDEVNRVRQGCLEKLRLLQEIADEDSLQPLKALSDRMNEIFVASDRMLKIPRQDGVVDAAMLAAQSDTERLYRNMMGLLHTIEADKLAMLVIQKNNEELKHTTSKSVLFFTLLLGFGILVFVTHAMRREVCLREKAQRYEEARSRVLELIANRAPLSEALGAIIRSVEQEHPVMLCSILLLDQDGKHLVNGAAPSLPDFYNDAINGLEIGLGVGSCGASAFTGQRVIVEDIQNHPNWTRYKAVAGKAGLAACWSEPILSANGKVLGTFAIYHHDIHLPTAEHVALIEQSANLASIAIERWHAAQQLKESEERWKFALEGAGEGVWEYDFQSGVTRVSKRLREILGFSVLSEFDSPMKDWAERIHPENQALAQAALQAVRDNKTDHYVVEHQARREDGRYVWLLSRGMVVNRGKEGQPVRMIGTSSDITDRKLLEFELQRQAHLDYLTGLANRRHFMEQGEVEWSRAMRYKTPLSVLMLDVDYFKRINDQYGHKAGDNVLQTLALCCQEILRHVDIMGRLGGEEFAIVLPETGMEKAMEVAERLRKVLADTGVVLSNGSRVHFTVSIGVTTLIEKELNFEMLLDVADQALYAAKETGRNNVCCA